MTRQSSIARAALLDRPGPAFIARFTVDGEPVDFPVTEDDLAADSAFWRGVLAGYGIGRGGRAVVAALPFEAPWFQPARMAVASLGGAYSNVEPWAWDARRLDMFCRRLQVTALVGPDRGMLEGLSGIGDLSARLAAVPALLVRPDAVAVLEAAGITHGGMVVVIGPAVAVSAADGSGLAYDTTQWTVESDDGELVVTAGPMRAARFVRQRTGVAGTVERTGSGPRVRLTEQG